MAFGSGFATVSDPRLAAALASALAALGASVLMLVATLALRVSGRAAGAARRRTLEAWRPLFAAALSGDVPRPRALRRREAHIVMVLFEQLALTVRGEGVQRLAAFARQCGLARWALEALHHQGIGNRLLAMSVLGHLGHAGAFEELAALARRPDVALSVSAARALLRLNARRAAPLVVDLARRRADWPSARLVDALRESESPSLWTPLHRALEESRVEELPRLLEFLAALPADVAAQLAFGVLESQGDPSKADATVIAACLPYLADPHDVPKIRSLVSHRDARVRRAAVAALGRLASEDDLPRLAHALSDREWSVRQAAADALCAVPFLDEAWLERLRAGVSDRYAADALARAIAERR